MARSERPFCPVEGAPAPNFPTPSPGRPVQPVLPAAESRRVCAADRTFRAPTSEGCPCGHLGKTHWDAKTRGCCPVPAPPTLNSDWAQEPRGKDVHPRSSVCPLPTAAR